MLNLLRRAKTGASAAWKRASRKPRNSSRTGFSSCAENSSPMKSKPEKTTREASKQYLRENDIITQGQRNQRYVDGQHGRSRLHLVPFFDNLGLSEITAVKVQEYRIHRYREAIAKRGKPAGAQHHASRDGHPAPDSENRHGWLDRLPDLSEPYRSSPKISHRARFSFEEYKQLYEATRKRAHEPKQERYKKESEQLHDYVLFAVSTGLRPDEVGALSSAISRSRTMRIWARGYWRLKCAASAASAFAKVCPVL